MKVVEAFPRPVREIENFWIPLSDGCRLAARIWLPENAEDEPVPAILECLPYRKRDGTAWRDAEMHPYIAGHGYAAVRVDLRGSGESDGVLPDEYTGQEHDDCVEAIRWVAAQPWCNGKAGMWGISWGGFNALQVAARRPPELTAIVAVMASDDRYHDDVHYMGGCMLHDNFAWASAMFAYLSLPPDPKIVGEGWREIWMMRLDNARLWLRDWLAHQRRDDYWKHGSVCEDYSRIACPVYAVGGWEDGYSNAVPRLLAGLDVPAKGLAGPWGHAYPQNSCPGPSIGFLQEVLRWWDHWLKGIDTGMMDEPAYRVWINDSYPPAPFSPERPGRWAAEPGWPSPRITERPLYLNDRRLEDAPGAERPLTICSPQETGVGALEWCSYGGAGGDLPTDQREDDSRSLCFDSTPLSEALEILGPPVARLAFSVDRPVASVAVRLCDVAPDGASTRVTYSLFNLTHWNSHEAPEPLTPGRRYETAIPLNHIAHRFLPGHRLRLAVSTCYWPQMWPSPEPEPVTLTLFASAGRLDLPVRPPRPEDDLLPAFAEPEGAPPLAARTLRPDRTQRTVSQDLATGETRIVMEKDSGAFHMEAIDLDVDSSAVETYRVRAGDPLSARGDIAYRQGLGRGDWRVRTETRTSICLTATAFQVTANLDAYEGDRRVFGKTESFTVPRDLT
ncbi:CocE/NonD family hydrolase [Rhodospirillaceae bacterium SYSU D60014]|uniref:CocE/NonD family hydrolase n=1 Tax=Virgifigura deserti TaxID=2268457 RepID=UPI000E660A32